MSRRKNIKGEEGKKDGKIEKEKKKKRKVKRREKRGEDERIWLKNKKHK